MKYKRDKESTQRDDVASLDESFHFDAEGIERKCFGEMRFLKLVVVIRLSSVGDMVPAV